MYRADALSSKNWRTASPPFPGDVFEVEIEGMGVLSNPVQDE
jgi:2-keto-4-pentenoate hydratase/2-oxohepta-3-ene-1,7-dioic acid hydratase in catechol pathway